MRGNEAAVIEALEAVATFVKSTGHGRFDFTLENGTTLSGTARVEDHWVRFEADAAGAPRKPWDLLGINAGLPGPAKLAWPPGAKSPVLLADLGYGSNGSSALQVSDCCRSLLAAQARLEGQTPDEIVSGEIEPIPDPKEQLIDAGWKATSRDDGSVVVDLETNRDYYQAELRRQGSTSVRLTVPLARLDALDAVSQEAIARFLLGANASLRLARAAVVEIEDGRRVAPRFEIFLRADADAAAVNRALAALSIACATYGPEIRILAQPWVAESYLRIRGGSPVTTSKRRGLRMTPRKGGAKDGHSHVGPARDGRVETAPDAP